jgi:hypothetical protein
MMGILEKQITREQAQLLFDVSDADATLYYLRLIPIYHAEDAESEYTLFADDREVTDWADAMSFEWWDEA